MAKFNSFRILKFNTNIHRMNFSVSFPNSDAAHQFLIGMLAKILKCI